MKDIEGFTLIELLITIAILAIVAMLAAPSFQSIIRANELRSGVDKVTVVLSDAKNNARLTRQTSTLKLDGSYQVDPKNKEYDLSTGVGKNVVLTSTDKAIAFLANGLIETTAKTYPVCINIKHSKSLTTEYISVTQLGFITRSKTSCDTK